MRRSTQQEVAVGYLSSSEERLARVTQMVVRACPEILYMAEHGYQAGVERFGQETADNLVSIALSFASITAGVQHVREAAAGNDEGGGA